MTREVGIRRALGATGRGVATSFLGQSALHATIGIMGGAVGAAILGRSLGPFLFDVTPFDPEIYAYASACLLLIVVLAALFPAMRAAQVSPLRAISVE